MRSCYRLNNSQEKLWQHCADVAAAAAAHVAPRGTPPSPALHQYQLTLIFSENNAGRDARCHEICLKPPNCRTCHMPAPMPPPPFRYPWDEVLYTK